MTRLPAFLEPDELAAVLAVSPPRHRLFYLLCARAGLRVSEAVKVRHGDIQWRDGEPAILHLIGKGDKEALLPLAPSLRMALKDFTAPDREGWLFPGLKTHITDRQARTWLVWACEKAGVPREKAHPHALRHSLATHLLRAGVNLLEVQGLLRHSNIATTSIYLHSNPARLQAAVNTVDDMAHSPPGDPPPLPVLRRAAAVVLETITAEPGLTGAELAQRLSRREQRVNVDLYQLIGLGHVIPDGRPRRLFPAHVVPRPELGNDVAQFAFLRPANGHHDDEELRPANSCNVLQKSNADEELRLLDELERITRRKLELLTGTKLSP